jgi:hypothetical protein
VQNAPTLLLEQLVRPGPKSRAGHCMTVGGGGGGEQGGGVPDHATETASPVGVETSMQFAYSYAQGVQTDSRTVLWN